MGTEHDLLKDAFAEVLRQCERAAHTCPGTHVRTMVPDGTVHYVDRRDEGLTND